MTAPTPLAGHLQVAYLGLEVPDPASLSPVLADVVGLVPGEPGEGGTLTWRNDDKVHRVIVERGPTNDATYVGFETGGHDSFNATIDRLAAAGYPTSLASDEATSSRNVDRLAHVTAPWGVRIEIVTGLHPAAAPYSSPLMPEGFVTDGVGFGHVVFATTAFDEAHDFATRGLGLVQSDWLETEIAEGIALEVRFYHCNARHHTLALARAPFELPQQLHHFMVETAARDEVGAAFDRAWAAELPIPNGLGLHDNDRMFSFYLATPSGFQIEVGYGARTITEGWDDNRRYDRISLWGHQPLRQ